VINIPNRRLSDINKMIFRVGLVSLFFMNIFDALATTYWVTTGLANEKNPLMAFLLDCHPTLFIVVKLLVGVIVVWYLWERYSSKLTNFLVFITVLAYACVSGYHIYYLIDWLL